MKFQEMRCAFQFMPHLFQENNNLRMEKRVPVALVLAVRIDAGRYRRDLLTNNRYRKLSGTEYIG